MTTQTRPVARVRVRRPAEEVRDPNAPAPNPALATAARRLLADLQAGSVTLGPLREPEPEPAAVAMDPAPVPEHDGEATGDPSVARQRAVLDMLAAGRTYVQIAAHFGRTERTIREWAKRAREGQVRAFRSRHPEQLAADIEYGFARSAAQWHDIIERARDAGDLKLEMDARHRLDDLMAKRARVLERLGVWNAVSLPKPPADPQALARTLLGDLYQDHTPPDDSETLF